MPKFSLEKIVDTRREFIYNIFSNYENYQKLFPQHFPSIRIISIRGNVAVVEEHMNLGNKKLVIMTKHITKKPILHEIFVIGGDIKGSYIKEQFVEVFEGTKILVDLDLKLNGKTKILNLLGKNKSQEDYTKILNDFAKIAEN